MKASAFRRWPVAGAYSPEQTTRLTGGSDFVIIRINEIAYNLKNILVIWHKIKNFLLFIFVQ